MKKAYLVLENGTVFQGFRFGSERESIGELVFSTGMCGYIETMTDPSFFGQTIVQTFPMIGNCGIIEEDFEGDCHITGYVVRDWCREPSNFRCQYDLDTFLKNKDVPGIYGIDTRALTRILRNEGVMNALITDKIPADLQPIKAYRIQNALQVVGSNEVVTYPPDGRAKYKVALMDYGAKGNIIRELQKRGCEVVQLPPSFSAQQILSYEPDGILLSNGPGNPQDDVFSIRQIQQLFGKKPIFGICLGHQLTALAAGGQTQKMKYGHRGGNQPVKCFATGRTYITSQNHGYSVIAETLQGIGVPSFVNVNDNSNEGMDYPGMKAITVQFHPEACAGPLDTSFLFDRFVAMMGGKDNA